MLTNTDTLTDLQLIDLYIEKCRAFVNPAIFRRIENRGLYGFINQLPTDVKEAKAIARARLAKVGRFYDEPEIDEIAGKIKRIESLREKMNKINAANADDILPLIESMRELALEVRDYYK